MNTTRKAILVVGGNGYLGSAVCRRALAKGLDVESISTSGRPFTTPKGHLPTWTSKVKWHKASALDPASYAGVLEEKAAVVHTVGVLLEGGYKDSVRSNNPLGLISSIVRNAGFGNTGNPLAQSGSSEYETMNRDSAVKMFETYLSAKPPTEGQKTFVYLSAADIFRPWVPKQYIDTKREAERYITRLCNDNEAAAIRGVFMRPGIMYHPHIRPLTTPLAVLLDISSRIHRNSPLNNTGLLPSALFRSLASRTPASASGQPHTELPDGSSSFNSLANLLEVPPIHVDQVADAIVTIIQTNPEVSGPVSVDDMRNLIGWHEGGAQGDNEARAKV